MSTLDLDQAEFRFHSEGLRSAELRVLHFSGHEALSQPYEFVIELVAEDSRLDLDAPLGKSAQLTIAGRAESGRRYQRRVHGIIARFTQLAAGLRYSRYQATLVPRLTLLGLGARCRIYQGLTAPAIAEDVLRQAGLASDSRHSLLHSDYPSREVCVQYQESDLSFVRRLWEAEGICFFFTAAEAGEIVNLGDGSHAFAPLPEDSTVALRDFLHHHEEGLAELQIERSLRVGATRLRDFRFQQPSLELEVTAQGTSPAAAELYQFPGHYEQADRGQRLAQLRLEEQQWQRELYRAAGNVRTMQPGFRFSLRGHPRPDCNRDYLITAVEHEGSQPQALAEEAGRSHSPSVVYRNRIECIPIETPFRPQRQTPLPRILGAQTAIVVAPAGEELHCDTHARVKLHFHWDRDGQRDDRSSGWVRVSQAAAGSGYGALFLPRRGEEVVVQFLDGDPDCPLIIGRVYNGEHPPPHRLPANKHLSGLRSASIPGRAGHNELRFDDRSGREELSLHAQRDLKLAVGHNHDTQVGADQSTTVHGGQSTHLETGDHLLRVAHGSSALQVQGHRQVTVHGGSHHLLVESGDSNQTVNSGHHTTLVRSGHYTLTVATGNHLTELQSGHHTLRVSSGNSHTEVMSGEQSTIAAKSVTLASRADRLRLFAATDWQAQGGRSAELTAPELRLTASERITLTVGESVLSLTPEGLKLSAPEISSSALTTHTISGAVVRIN